MKILTFALGVIATLAIAVAVLTWQASGFISILEALALVLSGTVISSALHTLISLK
jgi:hypothetical protein